MKANSSHFRNFFVLKYLILGLSIGFMIHASGSCRKDSYNPIDPDPVDVTEIKKGAKSVETAFLSGDAATIQNTLTENAVELYGADLPQINVNQLIKLGEALKTRELKVYTDMYAEFEYKKDGQTYTFAMAAQVDGSWKLMRF